MSKKLDYAALTAVLLEISRRGINHSQWQIWINEGSQGYYYKTFEELVGEG